MCRRARCVDDDESVGEDDSDDNEEQMKERESGLYAGQRGVVGTNRDQAR